MNEIEGIVEALEVLDKYPIGATKCVKAAVRKAGSALAKKMKAEMPNPQYRKLVKSKVYGKSRIIAKVGLYGTKRSSTGEITPWFKAYWSNYGTLKGRDSSHKFEKSISKGSDGRGIRHRNFFEKSLQGGERLLEAEFKKELDIQADKILHGKAK